MHFLSIFPFFMNIHIMQMSQLTLNHMQMRDWCLSYILVPSLFFYDKNWPRYDRIYTPCHCKEKGGCHGNSENKHSPNEFFHGNIIEYHSVDTNRQVGTHEKKSPGGVHGRPHWPPDYNDLERSDTNFYLNRKCPPFPFNLKYSVPHSTQNLI